MNMKVEEIALDYLALGLSVFPVKSPAMAQREFSKSEVQRIHQLIALGAYEDKLLKKYVRSCKVPLVPWKGLQSRLASKEEITGWFTRFSEASIAIVTGKISNLVVFDLDSDEAKAFTDDRGGLPVTASAATGRGYHLYMQHPGFEVRNDVNANLKIDIRADGGYVVAPPSVHANGRKYEWLPGRSILDVRPLACLPWMVEYLQEVASAANAGRKAAAPANTTERAQAEGPCDTDGNFVEILRNGALEGSRNDTGTRLIGHLLARGLPRNEAWEIVQNWNCTKLRPPLSVDELRATFESVCRLEKRNNPEAAAAGSIDIGRYLDNPERVLAEREAPLVQVSFGGDNLVGLERRMGGGLLGGRFYTIGGMPSARKTMLLNNMGDNITLAGTPVLFFSYDDGRDELLKRTLSRFGHIPMEQLNRNRVDRETLTRLCQSPTVSQILERKYVVEDPVAISAWGEIIEAILQAHGRCPVILIDYLRKLRTEKRILDERLRVDAILCALKAIAHTYAIPVVAISELGRDSYKSGHHLSMASFKESGSIEYESSWLGILAPVEMDETGDFELVDKWERVMEESGKIDLIVLKTKRGTGLRGRVPLKADSNYMIIRDRPVDQPAPKFIKKSLFEE
jgi:hypothetical protein